MHIQASQVNNQAAHSFHIPVMGLGFTVDSPIKVARFGISSVVSVMEDHLLELMRAFHSKDRDLAYSPIDSNEPDARARRIAAYLDMVQDIVDKQLQDMRLLSFDEDNDLVKYFELLPGDSALRASYKTMQNCPNDADKTMAGAFLKTMIKPGDIDINIMTKLDKLNYDKEGHELGAAFSDAVSALRGFAASKLSSSVVFSAGLNPRLYGYCEQLSDFYPDAHGNLKKKIILKVSDFRSARIQGMFLAKKGLWVSEFRIESGLNCGGHAFATDGFLMGPILEEFKQKRSALSSELFDICNAALMEKNKNVFERLPQLKITAQGGVGTADEHRFLLEYYGLDSIGWGSPFLLVPEATNVDDETLQKLSQAVPSDYYLSQASPLGVPFNNFRPSSSEQQRKLRIEKGRPGSPCYKKFLAMDTEFTDMPICTASRQYQKLKIAQIELEFSDPELRQEKVKQVMEKDCLCEGLGVPALLRNGIEPPHKLKAVVVCPGPNLAYFSGIFSLKRMTDHIYGRDNLLNQVPRPHLFVNELILYTDYLKNKVHGGSESLNARSLKALADFRDKLQSGIRYYYELCAKGVLQMPSFTTQLGIAETHLHALCISDLNEFKPV